jgi:putative PIN family toxin of toxin-antitoxin system
MRVVLDTNILLSGLISPAGRPALIIDAWLERRFTLVSHEAQLSELRDVSRREKIRALVKPSEVDRMINQIRLLAELPESLPPVERSRDPKDDFLLALCEAGAVDLLVTGDKNDLLALRCHGSSRIVTAADVAQALGIGG